MPSAMDAIYRAAKKYGIRDPHALAAVAYAESGLNPGSVGDGGTSFGLFQLHQGGALGSMGNSEARRYLDAYKNADFAARQMRQLGIHKLSGRDAVHAIVTKFERPANPGGEVERAWNWYTQNNPGAAAGGGPSASSAPDASSMPAAPQNTAFLQQVMDQNARAGKLRRVSLPLFSSPAAQPSSPADPMLGGATATGGSGSDYAASSSRQKFNGSFPTAKRGKMIGTPYAGTHSLGNWQSDNAVDIAVPIGTPIVAVTDGVVGSRFGSLGSSSSRFAGLRMTVQGKNNSYYYAHLSKFAQGIKPGTRVRRGQVIGYSGSANGVEHLHIGAERGDPRQIFGLR